MKTQTMVKQIIRKHGVGMFTTLSNQLNLHPRTIYRYFNGETEPNYWIKEQVKELYAYYCGKNK